MPEPSRSEMLVLVVEEESRVLGEVAAALTGAGYTCRCCRSAEEAIESSRSAPPQLVISAAGLGGESGLAMCERIQAEAQLGSLPVMLLSGTQGPDIIHRRSVVGPTYYLRKPLDPQVLTSLVDYALRTPQLAAGPL